MMKENRFDFSVFMAVIMIIVLIGGLLVGTAFGIVNNNQVAYADFVFNENLLPHTDYNIDFSLSGTDDIQGVPYSENYFDGGGTFKVVGSSLGVVATGSSSFALGGGFGFRYDNFVVGNTYTFTVDVVAFTGSPSLKFGFLSTSPGGFTGLGNITVSAIGSISVPYTIPATFSPTYVYIYVPQNASISFTRVKLEEGNTFTGWSLPTEDPNYQIGYNQGYQEGYDTGFTDGYDSSAISRLYTKLGDLYYGSSLLSSNFTFANVNYVMGDYTEDLRSLYSYNNPNFAVIDSLDGESSGSQIGFEISNDFLYGDILIVLPYSTYYNDFQVVFENTSNGEILYTNKNDTLHWFLSSHLGNVNNSSVWSIDLYVIKFFSPEPVNVYFLPMNNESDYGSNPVYFNLSQSLGAVYSTQSQVALNDFDDGYQKGLKDGADSAVQANAQAVSNARAAGYEEGRRDALADSNDYTFVGLLGAVFDAPIKSFQGLLNFDVLGVNMQTFVLALLSLSVIIIILKIALGGK